jgi:hypothetical protein
MHDVACLLRLRRACDRTAIARRPQWARATPTQSLRLSLACSIKRRRFSATFCMRLRRRLACSSAAMRSERWSV